MCLYEYDEEKQREFDREEGREEGKMELLEELVRSHKLSYEEVAEFAKLTVEEVKALDTVSEDD